jgi:metal-responsive CopG/Arc/MetJ family transcriptional regulator
VGKRNVTLSLDAQLLERVEKLSTPGENRSALVERLLRSAIRVAEDAALDAAYDRALAAHPVTEAAQRQLQARANSAYRNVHGARD